MAAPGRAPPGLLNLLSLPTACLAGVVQYLEIGCAYRPIRGSLLLDILRRVSRRCGERFAAAAKTVLAWDPDPAWGETLFGCAVDLAKVRYAPHALYRLLTWDAYRDVRARSRVVDALVTVLDSGVFRRTDFFFTPGHDATSQDIPFAAQYNVKACSCDACWGHPSRRYLGARGDLVEWGLARSPRTDRLYVELVFRLADVAFPWESGRPFTPDGRPDTLQTLAETWESRHWDVDPVVDPVAALLDVCIYLRNEGGRNSGRENRRAIREANLAYYLAYPTAPDGRRVVVVPPTLLRTFHTMWELAGGATEHLVSPTVACAGGGRPKFLGWAGVGVPMVAETIGFWRGLVGALEGAADEGAADEEEAHVYKPPALVAALADAPEVPAGGGAWWEPDWMRRTR